MKLIDREVVPGTGVTIGRRVQHRRQPDGRSEARPSASYTAVYTDDDGQRRTEGLGRVTLKEARRKAVELQRRIDEGRPRQKRRAITIRELINHYLNYNENRQLTDKTRSKYRADLQRVLEYADRSTLRNAADFDEMHWHAYQAYLRSITHKQGRVFRPKTMLTNVTILKQMMRWGVRNRLLNEDPLAGVRLPRIAASRPYCPTPSEIERLIEHADEQTRTAIVLLWTTGLRIGELIELQWSDVSFDTGSNGVILVRRGGSGGSTKTGRERSVPLHRRARSVLEQLPRNAEHVLPKLRERTLLARIKRLAIVCGVSQTIVVHSFRHAFCRLCADNGVPIFTTRKWLGHSGSGTGMDMTYHYYSLSDEQSHAAMSELADRTSPVRSR